eukprot:scaffold1617_cov99-Skeletonema_dohrnii-CCMP3373.AAC.4
MQQLRPAKRKAADDDRADEGDDRLPEALGLDFGAALICIDFDRYKPIEFKRPTGVYHENPASFSSGAAVVFVGASAVCMTWKSLGGGAPSTRDVAVQLSANCWKILVAGKSPQDR